MSILNNISINNLAEISFIGGTYRELTFDVVDTHGTPINIKNFTYTWVLSPFGQPEVATLTVTGSFVPTSGSNRFNVELLSDATVGLSGKYIQQPVIIAAPGYEFRMGQGYVTIMPAAGLETPENGQSLIQMVTDFTAAMSGSMAQAFSADGWIDEAATWTRTSGSSFTVAGNYTNVYSIGDKFKTVIGGSAKQGYFTSLTYSAPNTIVTTIGDSLTTGTLSSNHYSHGNPAGFAETFAWNGASGDNPQGFSSITSDTTAFWMEGKTIFIRLDINGTSNSTSFTLTLPYTPLATAYEFIRVQKGASSQMGMISVGYSGTTATLYSDAGGTAWDSSGVKKVDPSVFYYKI